MKQQNTITNLSLYHHDLCPYCAKVKRAIKTFDLGSLEPVLRNIKKHEQHRLELVNKGGKQQVPALKIEFDSGQAHWLYESDLIIDFLSRFDQVKKSA